MASTQEQTRAATSLALDGVLLLGMLNFGFQLVHQKKGNQRTFSLKVCFGKKSIGQFSLLQAIIWEKENRL